MSTTAAKPTRRTQAERSAATRARLLEATLESLVELGYTRTTTTVIADRAGVSRGAQMHHFPSKAELVAAAVEHLADLRAEQIRDEVARLPKRGRDRVQRALELLWESHRGPLFQAALELWVAARTDAELRARLTPVEVRLATSVYALSKDLFGEEIAAQPQFALRLAMALTTMQGLTLINIHELDQRMLDRAWGFYRGELARMFAA
jgi:AcrR family transcriptional regulator